MLPEVIDGSHPLVAAAQRLATDLLGPRAAEVDQGFVPRSHLDALAAAGLFALADPGAGAPPPAVVRSVTEVLAGADLATWFVLTQHDTPVRMLAETGRFEPLVADLLAGRRLAGVGISQLRRWPAVPLSATPVGAGWQLDGVVPWYTGWQLNDVALVAGASAAGDAVFGVIDLAEAVAAGQLNASAVLEVAALRAARTVTLRLERLQLSADQVVGVPAIESWAQADRRSTVNVKPAVFGVALSALRLLHQGGISRGEPAAIETAERIGARVGVVRARAYALLDEVEPDQAVEQRLRLRSLAHRLMIEATTALVIAGAGGSMAAASPAQRKAREALFMLVQAQTLQTRTAALHAWASPGAAAAGVEGLLVD